MNLDLSAARSTAEGMLVDRCRILRDPQGKRDDVLDRATLQLSRPSGDETVVYEGPCLVSERRLRAGQEEEGGGPVRRQNWQVRIPLSAPETRIRDIVLMLASRRPELVGRRFRIGEINRNTLATTRRHFAEDVEGATAR